MCVCVCIYIYPPRKVFFCLPIKNTCCHRAAFSSVYSVWVHSLVRELSKRHANCSCNVSSLSRITAPTFPTQGRKTMTRTGSEMPVTMMMTMIKFQMTG